MKLIRIKSNTPKRQESRNKFVKILIIYVIYMCVLALLLVVQGKTACDIKQTCVVQFSKCLSKAGLVARQHSQVTYVTLP